jgi:hypothetical protein
MGINESELPLDMIGDGEDDLINGTVDIDGDTRWEDEDIEYISLGLKEDEELEEGFDDHILKHFYDDYSPKTHKKLPKNIFEPGLYLDHEGTKISKNDDDFDEDFEDDDNFEPMMENDFMNEVDEEVLPEFTEKLNESLDMFRRFKKYN